uniref:Uncharacterized protein n=1 Tax=Rhizophora mucronata TaxID=61149 RepID=A0A2P2J2L7_RHIMU
MNCLFVILFDHITVARLNWQILNLFFCVFLSLG